MASVTKFIKDFARSPRGQQLIKQVKEQANKPANRRKLEELRQEGQQLMEQVNEQANKPENRRKLEELRKRYGKRF